MFVDKLCLSINTPWVFVDKLCNRNSLKHRVLSLAERTTVILLYLIVIAHTPRYHDQWHIAPVYTPCTPCLCIDGSVIERTSTTHSVALHIYCYRIPSDGS